MTEKRPKHAVLVIPCLLIGGTEYQTLSIVKAISTEYPVTVICMFEHHPAVVAAYEREGATVVLLSPEGTRPIGILNISRFLLKALIPAVRQVKPAIIHTQYMHPGAIPLVLLRLAGFSNLITTIHVPGHIYKNKFVPRIVARYITKMFICVSLASEQELFGAPGMIFTPDLLRRKRKHCTVYNCIDTADLPLDAGRESRMDHSGAPVVIAVARLDPEKGVDVLMDAIPAVLAVLPEVKFRIVGDGQERVRLERLAAETGVSNRVEFLGRLPREEVFKILQGADIAVIPSRFEGFGLSALEAMACGIPVVASDTGGLKEIVVHNATGLLFPVGDAAACARSLITLLKDPGRAVDMGQSARQNALQKFGFSEFKSSIRSIYSNLA